MQPLYKITGKVEHGAKRGRDLGYPTANMQLHIPIPEGIYISKVIINNINYMGATFIGAAQTFGETISKAETFILHFNENIYDQEITIYFLKKIRDNMKYTSVEALIEQMKIDIKETEEYFVKNKIIV